MSLSDAIAEALANSDPPPPNESTTCEWILYPLFLGLGYSRREIVSRLADYDGKFPDYTILPETPHAWYLEAKAWGVALDDRHAQQSLNYANANGKRWVVLTNGLAWRLYDNRIEGVAADKAVACAVLSASPTFEDFLRALRRDAVTAGELDRYARRMRLAMVLRTQLTDENSDVIRATVSAVRRRAGLSDISPAEVVDWYGRLLEPAAAPREVLNPTADEPGPEAVPAAGYDLETLRADASRLVRFRRPSELVMPDGRRASAGHWSGVAREAVAWLLEQQRLPALPFQGRRMGKCYFLNAQPMHKGEPMRRPRRVDGAGRSVFIDVNRSGEDLVSRLCELCDAAGLPRTAFRVQLQD